MIENFRQWRWPARVFRDPLAALIQKELQSLIRMPRFRILFGMSCLMGALVFIPAALHSEGAPEHFARTNLILLLNVYGLLLLGETLLLNVFGFDRAAVQTYFVVPVSFAAVLKAKNCAALVLITLQTAVVLLVAILARVPLTAMSISCGLLGSAVTAVFLLTAGNLLSVTSPKAVDPKQTFRKQGGAKMQIWSLGATVILASLLGFGFLARYALQNDWALPMVLVFELLVCLIVYRLGFEAAVDRGIREREQIVESLSRAGSPLSLN